MGKEYWNPGERSLRKIPKRGKGWNNHLTPKELRESKERASGRFPAITPDLSGIIVLLDKKSSELKNNPPKLK